MESIFNCDGFTVDVTTVFTFPMAPDTEATKERTDMFGLEFELRVVNDSVYPKGDLTKAAIDWETQTDEQKIAFVSEPLNNIYLLDDGSLQQLVWELHHIRRSK